MFKYHRIARGILQSRLLDEPYHLNISLTNRCDSRCKTCDIWKIYPERRLNPREELASHEFQSIFQKLPSSVMWVSFSGGEPHLRKDFCEIMEACFSEVKNIALVNVPNSGPQRPRCVENWRYLLAIKRRPFVYISMSIDGPRSVHDEIRGVEGNYDAARVTLSELRSIVAREGNAEVGVGITVSKFNQHAVLPLVEELVEEGVPIKVETAYSGDLYYQGFKGERPELQDGKVREAIEAIYRLLRRRQWSGLSFRHALERSHLEGTVRFLAYPNRLVVPCSAARSSVAFDCYGNVNPCFFYSPGLGSLRDHDYDLRRLLRAKHKEVVAARRTIDRQECSRCWLVCNSIESMIDRKIRAPWRPILPGN